MDEKGQSKKDSIKESTMNATIGFLIAWLYNLIPLLITLPLFGLNVSFGDSLKITIIFTIISIIRGYLVRRWFNRKQVILEGN
jgi:hypothetical protein